LVFHLHKIASLQQLRELLPGQRQDMLRGLFELCFLIVIDIRPLVLGEPENEECEAPAPEQNNCPVTLRLPLSGSSDPLFDDPAAQIGVDAADLGPSNSLTQNRIRNCFFPGKALEPPGFEDSHYTPTIL
jgi:hypothetical protein